MRFDTSDTGKYCFDSRQTLIGEELSKLEDEYTAGLRSNPNPYTAKAPSKRTCSHYSQWYSWLSASH